MFKQDIKALSENVKVCKKMTRKCKDVSENIAILKM